MGFYLSEHTRTMAEIEQSELAIIEPKPEMTPEEILTVLTEARVKNKKWQYKQIRLLTINTCPIQQVLLVVMTKAPL